MGKPPQSHIPKTSASHHFRRVRFRAGPLARTDRAGKRLKPQRRGVLRGVGERVGDGNALEERPRRRGCGEDGRGGPADVTAPNDGRHRLALERRESVAVEDDDDVLARPRVVGGLKTLHGAEVLRLLAYADGEEVMDVVIVRKI